MSTVYVVQQLSKIRISNRRLQVENDQEDNHEVLLSVPLAQVTQVVLYGNIGLTTPAMDALLAQDCEVVFLTEQGEYRGTLCGYQPPQVPLRRAQYRALDRPEFCLALAAAFVSAKIGHQRALLGRHNPDPPDAEISRAVTALAGFQRDTSHKTQLSSLRGLEGASTAAYFSGYRKLFAPEWNFHNRNRRPPADPINVLLSFGYTLMVEAATGALRTVGLDPYAGFLHEVVYNRPALALDMMEEFRPVVEGIVLWCCRGGQITTADFTPGPREKPVILGDGGKRRFLQAFENRMDMRFTHPIRQEQLTLRQCLVEQARQIANCLQRDSAEYRSMGFR